MQRNHYIQGSLASKSLKTLSFASHFVLLYISCLRCKPGHGSPPYTLYAQLVIPLECCSVVDWRCLPCGFEFDYLNKLISRNVIQVLIPQISSVEH